LIRFKINAIAWRTDNMKELKRKNRSTTLTRARFRVIRANGKVEQHILIFDPAELPSLKVNVFIELHPGDRLDDYFDLRDLKERTRLRT
jgi:hypothetical protein